MPLGIVSTLVGDVDNSTLITGALVVGTAYAAKVYASGRKSIWERDWTGKLIMIAAPPTPTTLALIDHLLHLPIPPQILYLPPVPSPLPESLLTIMHTMRLGIKSPLAQLHVEALPPTPTAVRDFVRKWAGAPMGTVGEGGRRVDAIVLGGGWECALPNPPSLDPAEDPEWTPNQFQYHFITSLLPSLLRAPAERDIRVITLVSPAWAAAMPGIQAGLEGKRISAAQDTGLTAAAAKRGVTSLLLQNQLALVLDTLASAAFSKRELVPDPDQPVKRRDESLQSNILALSVVMPWARDEVVRPVWGQGSFQWLLYIIFFPLVLLITPSPAKSIQSILHALSAPVKFPGDEVDGNKDAVAVQVAEPQEQNKKPKDDDEIKDPRRNGVRQGNVVRDCAVIDIPPVLLDPLLSRATYESLETAVEKGVKEAEVREKAYPRDKEAQ